MTRVSLVAPGITSPLWRQRHSIGRSPVAAAVNVTVVPCVTTWLMGSERNEGAMPSETLVPAVVSAAIQFVGSFAKPVTETRCSDSPYPSAPRGHGELSL